MARPKSDEKRSAIVAAAIKVIADQGLSAPTAMIAKQAGVSNGALFTYFETKAALLNAVYLQLKANMAAATTAGIPADETLRGQVLHVWNRLLGWAIAHPEERKALACLSVSGDITAASHDTAGQSFGDVAALLDRARAQGPMREAPLMFVGSLVMALVDATTLYMASDAANATRHADTGFAALWRMLA